MNGESESRNIFSSISLLLSSVCIIHCLSIPIILVLLPAVSQFFTETIENWLVISIIPLSMLGFLPTWFKHRNLKRLMIFCLSLTLIVAAQFLFHTEHSLYTDGFQISNIGHLIAVAKKPLLTFIGAVGLAWVTYMNNYHTHVCSNKNHIH